MRIEQNTIMSAELVQWLSTFMASSNQRVQEVQQQKDALEVKSAIYNDLRTKLLALKRQAHEMAVTGGLSAFGAKVATVGDSDVVSVSASSAAAPLAHSLHVQQMARAHAVISHRYTSQATDLADTLAGTKSFTIHAADHDYGVSVSIDAGMSNQDVLARVVEAINTATGSAARATAVTDTESTARLSLTSASTGTANKLTFVDTDGLLAALGLTTEAAATATAGGYIHADLGNNELDAKLTVDGIPIVRASNVVKDVIAGVTLTLGAEQAETDADVSFSIGIDTGAIRGKIDKFLETYNDAFSYLKSKVSVDRTTFERGALASEYGYSSLWQRLRVGVAGAISTSGDPALLALSQIGITSNDAGSFSVSDATKLEAALKSNLATVERLFNSADGVGARLEGMLDEYTKAGGVISNSSESVRSTTKSLDGRIERLESLQVLERDRLIAQYGALQEATQLQQSMLSMLDYLYSFLTS